MLTSTEVKQCICCFATITRTSRQVLSVWKKIRFCGSSCSMHWKRHGKPKSEMPPEPDRHCESCGELLARRDDEPIQAFRKRKFCEKHRHSKSKGTKQPIKHKATAAEIALGCIRYTPGSPEFERIAAQCLNR